MASFFSIHRPISVSNTVPPTSTTEAFDALFTAKKPPRTETDDVIFTLSSAVNSMENHLPEQDGGAMINAELDPQDGSSNLVDLKVSVDELTRRLRPFQPPPPPVPFDEAKAASTEQQQEQDQNQTTSSRESSSYSTVLTIHESTLADGRKTYEAHTGPFYQSPDAEAPSATEGEAAIEEPANDSNNRGTTYLERLRSNKNINHRTMHAISTRRRRKRKMKNHKWKKLLRRTRTLRRKLDKA